MNLKNINKTINFLNLTLNTGALANHEARFIKNVIRRLKNDAAAKHERNIKMTTMNEEKYPLFRESETIQFDKVFNGERCHHTGRERWDSPDIADCWFEYIDRDGDLHYGR